MLNLKSSILLCMSLLFSFVLISQNLFVEEKNWYKKDTFLVTPHTQLRLDTVNEINNEMAIVQVKYFYPDNQLAIEGSCRKGFSKNGQWVFYYPDGKLWSKRTYVKNALLSIDTLITEKGKNLTQGFARPVGKFKRLNGFNYIYNAQDDTYKVGLYRNGLLIDVHSSDFYSKQELSRVVVRKFETLEHDVLEELSIEEAIELQKKDPKPIFLNVTNFWNGYSKRAFKELFSDPEVASYIKNHFHLAYLDFEDSKDISFEFNGEKKHYKGSVRRHSYIGKGLGIRLHGTPGLIFIDNSLKAIFYHEGIELNKKAFLKQLSYIGDGYYKNQDWKEYSKETPSKE